MKKNINASLIFHVIRLSEQMKKYGDVLVRQYGITTQQWFILLFLANEPNIIYLQEHPQKKPLLAKELAEALNVSRANITNLLQILFQKKLVIQVNDKEDKRRKRLVLTNEGIQILESIEPERHMNNSKMLAHLSKVQKLDMIDNLKSCLDILKKDFE